MSPSAPPSLRGQRAYLRHTPRSAFTLIEVVGAVAAFVIAFLAGSAAFARLLQQQNVNYHRTLGSAAAMLLTDWHVDAGGGGFQANTVGPGRPLTLVTLGSQTRFKGTDYTPGDDVYVFKQSADSVDLSIYGTLIATLSPASAPKPFLDPTHPTKLSWRQLTFWYGSPATMAANQSCALEFVGRYLVPDELTP